MRRLQEKAKMVDVIKGVECSPEGLPVTLTICRESTITISSYDLLKCKYNNKGKCKKDKKPCKLYRLVITKEE